MNGDRRSLLIERIRDLAHGPCLNNYRPQSKSSIPSDAQILMHLFCTYMDISLPSSSRDDSNRTIFQREREQPFKNRHFVAGDKPATTNVDVAIHEVQADQPHYELIMRAKNNTYLDSDGSDDEDAETLSEDAQFNEPDFSFFLPTRRGRRKAVAADSSSSSQSKKEYVYWACYHGDRNVFHALVLFIHFINEFRNGELGDMRPLRKMVDLHDILLEPHHF